MAFAYKMHSQAIEEYAGAYERYESEQKGLGEQYANAVGDRIKQILLNPEQFSFVKGNYSNYSDNVFIL